MFSSASFWFRGLTVPVQAFGKLPFYKDYLRWISSVASEDWRSWLVANYPKEVQLAEGIWPFIFCPAPETPIAVGLIEPSHDGLRDFPFSLFVILDRGIQKSKFFEKIIPCIWHSIGQVRSEIRPCENVEQFNRLIQKKMITIKKNDLEAKTPFKKDQIQLGYQVGILPKLFVFTDD